jgi:hypothetical protein
LYAWHIFLLAIGIDGEGNKHGLDFEQGSSESNAVVTALIERLRERGIEEKDERRLLVIRDGSPAIESAVRSHWPTALQQECLIHQTLTSKQSSFLENVIFLTILFGAFPRSGLKYANQHNHYANETPNNRNQKEN